MFVNQTESTLFIHSLKQAGITINNEREVIERLAEARSRAMPKPPSKPACKSKSGKTSAIVTNPTPGHRPIPLI